MKKENNHHVCPMEKAGSLEKSWRRWLQNPNRILKPFVQPGMTVLDMGCGPGFFTIPMAEMVGESGRVIAVDLQQGMLDKVKQKIQGTDLASRIELHLTEADNLNINTELDFVLAFYLLHELPDLEKFLQKIKVILKPSGKMLVAEPNFRVSKDEFANTLVKITNTGFNIINHPRICLAHTVLVNN